MAFPRTLGVVLAGGLSRRMGGADKPLMMLAGRTLLDHVLDRLAPQCEDVIINANRDPAHFSGTGLNVVPDSVPDYPGPLAGILTALEWAALRRPSVSWIVSVPGDTPFVPQDLVSRLHDARTASGQSLACASSDSGIHYAVGLWPVHLRKNLRHAIVSTGLRSVRDWAGRHGSAEAFWPSDPYDPFFNVNTPEDLAQAQVLVEQDRARF